MEWKYCIMQGCTSFTASDSTFFCAECRDRLSWSHKLTGSAPAPTMTIEERAAQEYDLHDEPIISPQSARYLKEWFDK